MKHQYRQTKPPVIEDELYDIERPQKKRSKKKKPFHVVACGWKGFGTAVVPSRGITLGRYETYERAEQARAKYARDWANCVIVKQVT